MSLKKGKEVNPVHKITKAVIETIKDSDNLKFCQDINCQDYATCEPHELFCAKYIEYALERKKEE